MVRPPEKPDAIEVLIVEDENRLRELLRSAIPDMGFRASEAAGSEEALRIMEQQAHQIVVLDLNLPGMNGLDFFQVLHDRWPDTAVIILTGYGDLEAAQKAIRLEVVDFLTKPASLGELEASLERARQRIVARRSTEPAFDSISAPPHDPATAASLRDLERIHILATLERHHGNRVAAAAELGISVRKLYYRLSEYQLQGFIV